MRNGPDSRNMENKIGSMAQCTEDMKHLERGEHDVLHGPAKLHTVGTEIGDISRDLKVFSSNIVGAPEGGF